MNDNTSLLGDQKPPNENSANHEVYLQKTPRGRHINYRIEPLHPYENLNSLQDHLYQTALNYAELGWPVFPARDKSGSHKSQKHSDGKKWGATLDHHEIAHDRAEWPDSGIGIVTGPESRIFVIDLDTIDGHGINGIANFEALVAENSELPVTPYAESPTGSLHIYFRYPEGTKVSNSASTLAGGVDVRGDGGCILAPPTFRADLNKFYKWIVSPFNTQIADCPEWLLKKIVKVPKGKSEALNPPNSNDLATKAATSGLPLSYGERAVQNELKKLRSTQTGRRNDALNKSAFALGQLLDSCQLDEDHMRAELTAAAESIGLEPYEIENTLNSGLSAGLRTPRTPTTSQIGGTLTDDKEGPLPLIGKAPPGLPYPTESLGALQPAVSAVAKMAQAPTALAGSSALTVASLCVQGFANVETLNFGSPSPLSLFCMTSAVSGERKTASYKPFVLPVEEFEKEQQKQIEADQRAWTIKHASWKAQHDRLSKQLMKCSEDSELRDIEGDLAALGAEPKKPASTDRFVTEPTFEALIQLLETGQPSIAILSDEGGQFLGGNAMSSENQQKTLAGMNKLWSGDPIKRTRVRANDGHLSLTGKRLAAHLMVQPEILRNFMAQGLAEDIGFLPRFLLSEPETKVGTRQYKVQSVDHSSIEAFGSKAKQLLNTMPPLDEGTLNLAPKTLPLSAEARSLLVKFYNQVETSQRPGGTYEHIGGYASKIAEQAARISGVLTLWGDLNSEAVGEDEMANAISLAEYHLFEALRISGETHVSETTRRAELLRSWLVEKWTFGDIASSEIITSGPKSVRESAKALESMNLLEAHRWVVPLKEGTKIRGKKRKHAWRIVRPSSPTI